MEERMGRYRDGIMVKPGDRITADCEETSYVFKATSESFHFDNTLFDLREK